MIGIQAYALVAMLLFSLGALSVVTRKNIFVIYLGIELMLNALNLLFVALSRYYASMDLAVITLLIIGTIAAEAAVFLSLIVTLYRQRKTLDADRLKVTASKEG
jgi:NADH-quinone oxidoreductase subunit K